jgi:hypothetical protein
MQNLEKIDNYVLEEFSNEEFKMNETNGLFLTYVHYDSKLTDVK